MKKFSLEMNTDDISINFERNSDIVSQCCVMSFLSRQCFYGLATKKDEPMREKFHHHSQHSSQRTFGPNVKVSISATNIQSSEMSYSPQSVQKLAGNLWRSASFSAFASCKGLYVVLF